MENNSITDGGLIVLGQIQRTVDKMDGKLDDLVNRQFNFERESGTRLTKIETELETLKTVRKDAVTVRQAVWGAIGTLFAIVVAAFVIYEKLAGVV